MKFTQSNKLLLFVCAILFFFSCGSKKGNTEGPILADTTNKDTSNSNWNARAIVVETLRDTPEEVVQLIFNAATAERPELLEGLCPPSKKNSERIDCICSLFPPYAPHKCSEESKDRLGWADFLQFFKDGGITTMAEVNGDRAQVDFVYGPGGETEGTMNLILEDSSWYLMSFQ